MAHFLCDDDRIKQVQAGIFFIIFIYNFIIYKMRVNFDSLEHLQPLRLLANPLDEPLNYRSQENHRHPTSTHYHPSLSKPTLALHAYPYDAVESIQRSVSLQQRSSRILPQSVVRFIQSQNNNQFQKQKSRQSNPLIQNQVSKALNEGDSNGRLAVKNSIIYGNGKIIKSKQSIGLVQMTQRGANNRARHGTNKLKRPRCVVDLTRSEQQQQRQLTWRPVLNYTMNSKAAIKVQRVRKNYFKKKKMNVFDSLYVDAQKYASKRQLQRMIQQQCSKVVPRTNNSTIPIFSRLDLCCYVDQNLNWRYLQQIGSVFARIGKSLSVVSSKDRTPLIFKPILQSHMSFEQKSQNLQLKTCIFKK